MVDPGTGESQLQNRKKELVLQSNKELTQRGAEREHWDAQGHLTDTQNLVN